MYAGGFPMNNDWYCGKRSGINALYYTKPWVQAFSLYSYILESMSRYKTYTIKSAKDVKIIIKNLALVICCSLTLIKSKKIFLMLL